MSFSIEGARKPKYPKVRKPKVEGEEGGERKTKEPKKWSAINYIVWLLGRREYSRSELTKKLRLKFEEKGLPLDGIEEVLDRAEELGLQSDDRFLESQVRMKKEAGKGPAFIRAQLRQHDLSEAKIDQALAASFENDNEWLVRGYDLAERKFGEAPYSLPLSTKVFNTLLRRGFSFDIAKKVVSTSRADALEE